MSEDISLGMAAYNAYCDKVGWVSRFTQDRLPIFYDQEPGIQAAWEAAANAAVDLYELRNIEEFSRALRG